MIAGIANEAKLCWSAVVPGNENTFMVPLSVVKWINRKVLILLPLLLRLCSPVNHPGQIVGFNSENLMQFAMAAIADNQLRFTMQ